MNSRKALIIPTAKAASLAALALLLLFSYRQSWANSHTRSLAKKQNSAKTSKQTSSTRAAHSAVLRQNSKTIGGSEKTSAAGVVNLNEASLDDLVRLPGIGPKKAAAVLAWRTKHGRFKRVVDLRRVKGIGSKTLKKLRPQLAVNGPTTLR